jgi:hypothetical protein
VWYEIFQFKVSLDSTVELREVRQTLRGESSRWAAAHSLRDTGVLPVLLGIIT